MTFSKGRDLFMTPGPSVMPDVVLNAMHRAAPNIYEGELVGITDSILADLKTIAGTDGQAAIYICNGHGIWEAALANVLAPGDYVLNLMTGPFATGWADVANKMGIHTEFLEFGASPVVDGGVIAARLKQDHTHQIKAVMLTHTDTSSSVCNNVLAVRRALDACNHPALLLTDCVASFGCERFEMDNWGVDLAITASQKGLMTPPGLAYLFFNEKAAAVARKTPVSSAYWDWDPRINGERFYQKFFGTAPTHHLFAQRAALDLIMNEGLEAVWHRHATFARAIWACIDAWAQAGPLRFHIENPEHRSNAVTTIIAKGIDCSALRTWCQDQAGLTLGIGLGFDSDELMGGKSVFRIGHMGHLNPVMVLGALATIDAGLKALKIPHGNGALSAASQVIATA